MSQPKFVKEVELAKVNFLVDEWRGTLYFYLGVLFSAMVGFDAVIFAAGLSKPNSELAVDVLVGFSGAFFSGIAYFLYLRPYRKRIRRLDTLLNKIRDGQSIGDFESL